MEYHTQLGKMAGIFDVIFVLLVTAVRHFSFLVYGYFLLLWSNGTYQG